ncbi:NF-X1-type zinc finger protein NFXL1-like [Varroa destructor]|uniref:NF-X1-type zinc finger protein NFXL1 n=1 Tax=Varroa destructor TaxID=109461 RepID=A0A7M7K203_VARDE|nr:NF-X1-type zinc finger protein NFXL1-like [Varroa destructor]XP_022660548.1 NF-X1-type zinc finger protein NFXL1-like [Varroa destructor]XP_022660549.1 NF-X1-type zinc finger protein NFXL1-like [Varroa destructor]XP_022660551.1 NF-X1-type zinc finger protein NFXL1-like [Varroa destructor]XP_022660552.1 NF-X1-type zinc finger protein NFXL1-like [Varroa destructor]XP_022660553.1 NF-X1-type zinc finger protein NFXL1-like [Varroa destructor]XP_022660554.1 NF-X1-type zinc finger protein NFXL1-l
MGKKRKPTAFSELAMGTSRTVLYRRTQESTEQGTTNEMAQKTASRQPTELDSSNVQFERACAIIQEQTRLQLEKMKDLYEIHEAEPDEDIERNAILDRITQGYAGEKENSRDIMSALLAGSITCVICIENVRHQEATWSCTSCYQILHLDCVNKWAKDSLYPQAKPGENVSTREAWSCPNCRADYHTVSNHYECFCGKERDPKFDKWICPHSCGSICGRDLRPKCGHHCTLLCHPGACPACPKTIQASCFCKKTSTIRRCSQKQWSCLASCGQLLACGLHQCPQKCHAGPCPPCSVESIRKCNCGSKTMKVRCQEGVWKCQKICRRQLNCGNHECQEMCHKEGDCGVCPQSRPRSCPCGRTKHIDLSCTQLKVPTCLNTCEKMLSCGMHRCWERCHENDCPTCSELVTKSCRCGAKNRQLQCGKDFTCDSKCGRQKPCGHICNRKCCPPSEECPPCTVLCNRKLQCGNHKCQSVCHRGPCYPCREQKHKTCPCGKTTGTFPCGTNMKDARVVCRELCEHPPDCHHPKRSKHYCHSGRCPSCAIVCDKTLACGHNCPEKCHSAVLTKVVSKEKPRGPWEPQPLPYWDLVNKPCAPCNVLVAVDCLGGHGVAELPCHAAKLQSCGRLCGRLLPCGNHTCTLQCHEVIDPREPHLAGFNCALDCGQRCPTKGRPKDCIHLCGKHCHSGDCAPCNQYVQFRCYCGNSTTVKPCKEWCALPDDVREASKSCGQRCGRNLDCGHRCFLKCHPDRCPEAQNCKKKVTVYCTCKRIKQEVDCAGGEGKTTKLKCDGECKRIVSEKRLVDEERIAKQEAERNACKLERVLGDRKKKRKRRVNDDEEEKIPRDINIALPLALSTLSIVVLAVILKNWLAV